MKLTLNGKEEEFVDGATVAALIKARGLNGACIVVEYNHAILKQDEWETVVLKPHDMLEIVSFVGGG
ncbi:MAG TPA: thiamine biosynthesis protein ThiS [Sporomusaceae bacterium]|jgi:sulfur carrier protein|uniref:sulfur carrier protein ThiS n=1 Tax=Anaerospora sp. TaxID=1960278 RepID=UPI000ECE943E|nr:sulfur carrier protein ThiS [Anaerospora sp.]HAK73167.1 thiamine biosynthesis protein ThiS [Sporomusaceae bacterium]